MSAIGNMIEVLRRIWEELNAGLDDSKEATLHRLDEHRMSFTWQGQSLLLDSRAGLVLRRGVSLVKYDDVQAIGIIEHMGDDALWSVVLRIENSANISIGKTRDQVDASIAAAHLSKATGKRVCVL